MWIFLNVQDVYLIYSTQDIQGPSTSQAKTSKEPVNKRKKLKKPRVEIEYEVEAVPTTRQRIHQWGKRFFIDVHVLLHISIVINLTWKEKINEKIFRYFKYQKLSKVLYLSHITMYNPPILTLYHSMIWKLNYTE